MLICALSAGLYWILPLTRYDTDSKCSKPAVDLLSGLLGKCPGGPMPNVCWSTEVTSRPAGPSLAEWRQSARPTGTLLVYSCLSIMGCQSPSDEGGRAGMPQWCGEAADKKLKITGSKTNRFNWCRMHDEGGCKLGLLVGLGGVLVVWMGCQSGLILGFTPAANWWHVERPSIESVSS